MSAIESLNRDGSPRPLDENCLHCVLGPVITKWLEDHPPANNDITEIIADVLQVAGELIASTNPPEPGQFIERAQRALGRNVHEALVLYRAAGKFRRKGGA